MDGLAQTYPATNAAVRADLLRFWEAPRGPQRLLAFALAGLQALMVLLLLAVCGNMATLLPPAPARGCARSVSGSPSAPGRERSRGC
jgi:hypothetical protein